MRLSIRLPVLLAAIILTSCGDEKSLENPMGPLWGVPHFFFLETPPNGELLGSSPGITEYYHKLMDHFEGCDTLDGAQYRLQEPDSSCSFPISFDGAGPMMDRRYHYCFPEIPGAHVVLLGEHLSCMIYTEP